MHRPDEPTSAPSRWRRCWLCPKCCLRTAHLASPCSPERWRCPCCCLRAAQRCRRGPQTQVAKSRVLTQRSPRGGSPPPSKDTEAHCTKLQAARHRSLRRAGSRLPSADAMQHNRLLPCPCQGEMHGTLLRQDLRATSAERAPTFRVHGQQDVAGKGLPRADLGGHLQGQLHGDEVVGAT